MSDVLGSFDERCGMQFVRAREQRLRGGLECRDVRLVRSTYLDEHGSPRDVSFVSKRLEGAARRERAVYEYLAAVGADTFAPRLIGTQHTPNGDAVLLLEVVRQSSAWPWRDAEVSAQVLRRAAALHRLARSASASMPAWDYETELAARARDTLKTLEGCYRDPALRALARAVPAARRLVRSLEPIRRHLLHDRRFGHTPIHGDLHSGNVVVRGGPPGLHGPVFIDWGRARMGSALEDLSSWLHSLGAWEPEARRRHDTLIAEYLGAFDGHRELTAGLRARYVLAGASNALAGAILHHVSVARTSRSARKRRDALRSALVWTRLLRRADELWRRGAVAQDAHPAPSR